MQAYVCGFLFSEDKTKVALIQKTKPAWQAGMLNAVGGKVEVTVNGDTITHIEQPLDAMVREFEEETGVYIPPTEWKYRVHLVIPDTAEIFFFSCFSDVINEVKTVEEEQVGIYSIDKLVLENMIPNLRWLIPLCLDDALKSPIEIEEAVTKAA